MPVLTTDDLLDLTKATLKDLGWARFQQIAQPLQRYEVMPRWLKKDKMVIQGSVGVQRNLMLKTAGAARHVGLAAVDDVNVTSLMAQMSFSWVHATTAWAVEVREAMMNKGKAFVFDVVKPRRMGSMIDLAETLEERAWSAPTTTTSVYPYGLPYWVVKNAATGFNGGLPSGHTTLAGIDLTAYPNFKNYTFGYAQMSKTDAIPKMRTMHRSIRWKSPVGSAPSYAKEIADKFRVYVNGSTVETMESVGEAQNENLGRDLAPMILGDVARDGGGNLSWRGHPVIWVPELDADTSNPVYMINHETFHPVVLEGDYMRETTQKAPNQHNVVQTFIDLTYNFCCVDRRQNGVGYIN